VKTSASSQRKLIRACVAAALLNCTVVLPTTVHAKVDDRVQQALALTKAGRCADAYNLLLPDLGVRASDPDFNYAYGLAGLDSGHIADAILAFQRVLAVRPGNAEARAEIARAYALSGDVDTARAQFDTVLQDPTLPDPVRQRFTRLVRDYSKTINGSNANLTGFIDASGGYDSNINTATSLQSVLIPLFANFGPGTLSGNARAAHDAFAEVQSGLSGVTGVGRSDRLFASVLGSYHGNYGSRDFNQASATGTAGIAHSFANRDTVSLSGQAQQFWLGTSSYRQSYGAIGQYTHLLAGGRALSLSGQYFHLHYDNQPLLDANRYALGVSYADRRFVVSASGGREKTVQKAGNAQSNYFGDASISAELPITTKAAFVGGVGFDLRRYDEPDALFLAKRHDERVDASAGLKLIMSQHLSLRPRLTYTRNFSNIPIYDFKRFTASFGVRYEF
jgi:tetratricopeptide (TPR) repeat protein